MNTINPTEQTNNVAAENVNAMPVGNPETTSDATAPTKKRRRGINNETAGAARKKFHESNAQPNGLFLGYICRVECAYSTMKDEAKGEMAEFAGLAVPRLVITFCSPEAATEDRKYIDQTYFPIPSNPDTCMVGKDSWRTELASRFIKHILDVYYLKGRNLTEQEEDFLELPLYDADEDGMYISLEKEEVLEAYGKFFGNVAKFLNTANNGIPVFATKQGDKVQPIMTWAKLLRSTKNKKGEWDHLQQSGEFSFPLFIKDGVFEIYHEGKAPNIKVNPINERIQYVEIEKKAPNMGGVVGNGNIVANATNNVAPGFGAATGGFDNAASGFGAAPASGFGGSENSDLPF